MATSRSVELVGRVLGDRYRLLRPVGTGASAHVYAADDVLLRRRVAVKVLHPGLAGDEAFGRRFRAEARAAAGLRHPHILQVFDTGDDDGTPYVVMELLSGGSLRSLIDRGQLLTLSQAAAVGTDVAGALDYAHRHGLVHRDIKPANLIFDDEGKVAIADFGLARALAEATWTEPIGGIVGTARYAAPEQVRGERLDGRADVYALALVLVEAVTGQVPFAADSTVGTLFARLERPLAPGVELGPLAAVLARAGAVSPEDRLDAAALAAEIATVARVLPPPGRLPLPAPGEHHEVERDDSPTEIPGGRPVPFDIEAIEGRRPAAQDAPVVVAPPPPPPPAVVGQSPYIDDAGQEATEAPPVTGRRRRWRRWLTAVIVVAVLAGGGAAAVILTRPAPTHPVPVLAGRDQTAAVAALYPLHLALAVTSRVYDAKVPAGEVISQVPSGGRLREGSTVDVTISLGPQPIPVPTTLAGQSQADATTVLTTLGLTVGSVTQASSLTVPEGAVISSTPASGTLLPGQAVSLVVSTGKPIVAVPALSGSSVASFAGAQSALSALGLVAAQSTAFSDTVPKGQVISTAPAAGTSLRYGSTVTVTVSNGPDVVTVPSVVGDSIPYATQVLTNGGLVVVGVSGNPTAAAVATSPAAGAVVHRGSHVTITTG